MTENKYKKVEDIIVKRSKYTRRGTNTGYRGVVSNKDNSSKYETYFSMVNGNNRIKLHLGSYDTPEEAYIARLKFIDSLK